jgi:hypothetical protein
MNLGIENNLQISGNINVYFGKGNNRLSINDSGDRNGSFFLTGKIIFQ